MENGPLVQSPPANGARRGRSDLRSDRWSGEKEGGKATVCGTRGGEGGGRRGYKRRFAVLLDGIDGRQRVRRRRKLRSANVLWWPSIRRRKKSPTRNYAARVCASPLRSLEIERPATSTVVLLDVPVGPLPSPVTTRVGNQKRVVGGTICWIFQSRRSTSF